MNWKTDLRLSDLDDDTRIEVTCRTCGHSHYEVRAVLMLRRELQQARFDEVEKLLRCSKRTCGGPVRIALIYNGKMEGFVGGMA